MCMLQSNCVIISLEGGKGFALHKLWSQRLNSSLIHSCPGELHVILSRCWPCLHTNPENKIRHSSRSPSTHPSNVQEDLKSVNLETEEQTFS